MESVTKESYGKLRYDQYKPGNLVSVYTEYGHKNPTLGVVVGIDDENGTLDIVFNGRINYFIEDDDVAFVRDCDESGLFM